MEWVNDQQTPDLASILQTLSAYSPAPVQHPIQQPYAPAPETVSPENDELEEGEYDPAGYDPTLPLITASPAQPSTQASALPNPNPQLPIPPAQQPAPSGPMLKLKFTPPQPRPTTITAYAPALRYITAHIASNPDFAHRIRHLITTQHQHERQWWQGREELVKKLKGRDEGRRKLDSVLLSVGGKINPITHSDRPPEEELKLYDRKVRRALGELVAAADKELRRLKVPFFCVEEGLVCGKGEETEKGMVGKEELGMLRGKMVGLLEDLCGEDGG